METTDPYCWPSSDVLQNRLGLRDAKELAEAEARIAQVRDVALARRLMPGAYDLAHLCRFHKRLFGDVYDWAGKVRTVDLSKTHTFARANVLVTYADTVFQALREDGHLLGRTQEAFTDRLAFHLSEVNTVHPFREGNGRTQRAFFRQMAAAAGWRIDWSKLSKADNDSACEKALVFGGHEDLARVLAPTISRLET